MIFGCDGSYQSNDDEMVSELKSNDKKFVAVGHEGTILTSSDGNSWSTRTSGSSPQLYGINYGIKMMKNMIKKTWKNLIILKR